MSLEGRELLDLARRLAAEQGLAYASAAPLGATGDARYAEWIRAAFHGEMGYLEARIAERLDPAAAFAPFVSVLVFLAEHDTAPPSRDAAIGNIARYALGDDYHDVLKARLRAVGRGLVAADSELLARPLVDTAPLLEKVAAARAGLGWQGKNTNLLRTDRGSFFLLGELLVNRRVPEPEPAKDRCGVCTACIEICPTRAIVAPYVLDARRCISYLTIELRGPVPRDLRAGIGNRIFGCDDCQEVCPWNRFARGAAIAEFRARPGLRETTLEEWMTTDLETWRRIFRGSPVKRAKFDGFQRNVAIAAGNARDRGLVAPLGRLLEAGGPLARAHAAWALGEIAGVEAEDRLRGRLEHEPDPFVRLEIEAAVGRIAGPSGHSAPRSP